MLRNKLIVLTAAEGVLRPKYRLLPGGDGPRFAALAQAVVRRLA